MSRSILFVGLSWLLLWSESQSIAIASGPPVHSARLVAFEGETAPDELGLPSPYIFTEVSHGTIDANGGVAIFGERRIPITGPENKGMWTDINGQLTLAATDELAEPWQVTSFFAEGVGRRLEDDQVAFLGASTIYVAGANGIDPIVSDSGDSWVVHPKGQMAYFGIGDRVFVGEATPGGPQEVTGFGELRNSRPIVNAAGNVVFETVEEINGNNLVVYWQGDENGIVPLVLRGDPIPGTNGDSFSNYREHPSQNSHNEVFFSANLESGDFALLGGLPGAVEPIALQGDIAPETGGAAFTFFGDTVFNDHGDGAFVAGYEGGGDNLGVWSYRNGEIHKLAVEGESADHILPGSTFFTTSSQEFVPFINNRGHIVFHVRLGGPGISKHAVLVYDTAGELLQVIKTGDLLEDQFGNTTEIWWPTLPYDTTGNSHVLPSNGVDGRATGLSDSGKLLLRVIEPIEPPASTKQGVFVLDLPPVTIPEPTTAILALATLCLAMRRHSLCAVG